MENKFVNTISYYLYRVIEEYYKKRNIIRIFLTRVGLKNINMGKVAQLNDPFIIEHLELSAEDLFLGPDFLKDEYTLIGCPLVESPHYEFMQALQKGDYLKGTDYVDRWTEGKLDWRYKMPIGRQIDRWKNLFEKRMKEIENGSIEEVLIYKEGEKYYIYDGKHKAALSALIGKKIKCACISESCIFSYYAKYMFEIVRSKEEFSKHTIFYNNHYMNERSII